MAKRVSETQGELFRVGKFVVTTTGLRVNGTPPAESWAVAFAAIVNHKEGIQWAIGDLLVYADDKKFGDEIVEQAMDATGYTRGTLMNMKSLARTFPVDTPSRGMVSYSHHALAAGLDKEEAAAVLARAAHSQLPWEGLREEIKAMKRQRRIAQLPWPDGMFGIILADPPWQHELNALPPDRETENHYDTMPTDQICALAPRVQLISAPNCILYMWATSAKVVSGEASDVIKAWGYRGKAMHVWVKDLMGLGYWVRNRHEHLLIATRGEPVPPSESLRHDSVITAARGVHSEKPVEAYEIIERCYPELPKVELFARETREGWTAWGNEIIPETEPIREMRVRGEEAVPA